MSMLISIKEAVSQILSPKKIQTGELGNILPSDSCYEEENWL